MPTVDGFPPGAPSWVDLMTTNLASAQAFYRALFGWEFARGGEDVGGYTMCLKDGRPVAGIGEMTGEQAFPVAWTTYLSTEDAAATLTAATEAGGQVMAPLMDIKEGDTFHGRMAVIADPAGAVFGVWEPKEHRGSGWYAEPGSLAWSEVYTTDAAATRQLLQSMFGYESEQIGDGSEFDYTQFKIAGEPVCGVMAAGQELLGGAPSHWQVYFDVENVEESVKVVTDSGGSVVKAVQDSPFGPWAVVADPQGAVFALHTPSRG